MTLRSTFLAFFLLLFPATTRPHWIESYISPDAQKMVGAAAIAAATAYAGYKLISWGKHYIQEKAENKIVDEMADSVFIALTRNKTINTWSKEEKEAAFRKKAWLINIRKRALNKLAGRIQGLGSISANHRANLNQGLQVANQAFKAIDAIRKRNTYEREYSVPTLLDNAVEDRIVDSLILAFKPKKECSSAELSKKAAAQSRRAKIVAKLRNKKINPALRPLLESAIVTSLLSATQAD